MRFNLKTISEIASNYIIVGNGQNRGETGRKTFHLANTQNLGIIDNRTDKKNLIALHFNLSKCYCFFLRKVSIWVPSSDFLIDLINLATLRRQISCKFQIPEPRVSLIQFLARVSRKNHSSMGIIPVLFHSA